MPEPSQTNWKQLEEMPDAAIDTRDIPELNEDFYENAELHTPTVQAIAISADRVVPE